MHIQITPHFKKKTQDAIAAILVFIFLYILLTLLALGLTLICIAAGVTIILVRPSFITGALGFGICSIGIFVFIFLVKFLFKKHRISREHLTEIREQDEPRLFQLIHEISQEVSTDFPKKVYLSSEVNASVFYDSSFWSMFFPIRKNLHIGLGLLNTVTEAELRAILAHEFGHFSQRSMKVGSYVYHVNQVIFNMLYDNASFDNLIRKWAQLGSIFSLFAIISLKIIEGIQWVFNKMYGFVNIRYMALSREMEFHADEVAAHVTGYNPLKESLLRMNLAEHSYRTAIEYYNTQIEKNVRSKNILRDQSVIMHFQATENNLSFANNLPQVSELDLNKYNKSKLTITNQWASHPSTEERIRALEKTGIVREHLHNGPARLLLANPEKMEEFLTDKLFSPVQYSGTVSSIDSHKFQENYLNFIQNNRFDKKYNGYYDDKNPGSIDLENTGDNNSELSLEACFSKENVDLIYDYIGLKNDQGILLNISQKSISIRTFDYDGEKYKATDAEKVLSRVTAEIEIAEQKIKANDQKIYQYFWHAAKRNGKADELKKSYLELQEIDSLTDANQALCISILNMWEVVRQLTSPNQIKGKFNQIAQLEVQFKAALNSLLENTALVADMPKIAVENMQKYVRYTWVYFFDDTFQEEQLQIFLQAVQGFHFMNSKYYHSAKKELLKCQLEFAAV